MRIAVDFKYLLFINYFSSMQQYRATSLQKWIKIATRKLFRVTTINHQQINYVSSKPLPRQAWIIFNNISCYAIQKKRKNFLRAKPVQMTNGTFIHIFKLFIIKYIFCKRPCAGSSSNLLRIIHSSKRKRMVVAEISPPKTHYSIDHLSGALIYAKLIADHL